MTISLFPVRSTRVTDQQRTIVRRTSPDAFGDVLQRRGHAGSTPNVSIRLCEHQSHAKHVGDRFGHPDARFGHWTSSRRAPASRRPGPTCVACRVDIMRVTQVLW
jgi:hypothetical protein